MTSLPKGPRPRVDSYAAVTQLIHSAPRTVRELCQLLGRDPCSKSSAYHSIRCWVLALVEEGLVEVMEPAGGRGRIYRWIPKEVSHAY